MNGQENKEKLNTGLRSGEIDSENRLFKRKLSIIICTGIAVAMITVSLVSSISYRNSYGDQLLRQIDLGNQFLAQQNYEEAIACFTKVISIDSKSNDAVAAYLGRSRAYYGNMDKGSAYQDLATANSMIQSGIGTAATDLLYQTLDMEIVSEAENGEGDMSGVDTLLETSGMTDYQPDSSSAATPYITIVNTLSQLRDQCSNAEYDAIYRVLEDQQTISAMDTVISRLSSGQSTDNSTDEHLNNGGNGSVYITWSGGDAGQGITAIYPVDVQTENFENAKYMLYHGGYNADTRQRMGNGIWIGSCNSNHYLAEGIWVDDKPRGTFQTQSSQKTLNKAVVYRYISGNVTNGLYDGTLAWQFGKEGTSISGLAPIFASGVPQVIGNDAGGNYLLYDGGEGHQLVIEKEDDPMQKWGIAGFAEHA